MLYYYLYAYGNQYQTSQDTRLIAQFSTCSRVEVESNDRYYKGDNTNGRGCYPDIDIEEGHRNAHGQGIYACGNGHQEHSTWSEVSIMLLVVTPDRLTYHIQTYEAEQHKGDPVVNALDVGLEGAAEEVADEGHACLKAAEVQACDESVAGFQLLHRKALADGHGHGIHGKSHGQNEQFENGHRMSPYLYLCSVKGSRDHSRDLDNNRCEQT